MKFAITVLLTLQLALSMAFAKNDPLVLELKRVPVKKQKRAAHKTKKAAKPTKIAKAKKTKKSPKKDKYKDIFEGVEYGSYKTATTQDEDYFKELSDIKDLDDTEKLEDFAAIQKENRKERAANRKKIQAQQVATLSVDPQEAPEMKVFSNSITTVAVPKKLDKEKEKEIAKKKKEEERETKELKEFEQDQVETNTAYYTPVIKSKSIKEEFRDDDSTGANWSINPLVAYSYFMIDGPNDVGVPGNIPNRPSAAQSYDYFEGFGAGLLATFGTGRLRYETGLVYLRLGGQREVLDSTLLGIGEDYIEYRDRTYFAIPLMALYHFSEPNTSGLFGKAGVWPAYLTNGRIEQYGTLSNKSIDNTAEYNKMDFLGTLGLGGKLMLGSTSSIVVEGLYMRGLKQIYEVNYASGYNQGFLATFSLNFEI